MAAVKEKKAEAFDPAKLAEKSAEVFADPVKVDALLKACDAQADASVEASASEIVIRIPIGARGLHVHDGYANCKPEPTLDRRQAGALKMMAAVLSDAGARARNGRRVPHPEGPTVEDHCDAIRYILDRFADAAEAATGKSLANDFRLTHM